MSMAPPPPIPVRPNTKIERSLESVLMGQPDDYTNMLVGGSHKYMILGPVGEPGAYGSGWTAVDLKPSDTELWHAVATEIKRDDSPLQLLQEAQKQLLRAQAKGKLNRHHNDISLNEEGQRDVMRVLSDLCRNFQRWSSVSHGLRARRLLCDLVLQHVKMSGFSPLSCSLATAFSMKYLINRISDTIYLLSKFAGKRMVASASGLHVFVKKMVFLKTYKKPTSAFPKEKDHAHREKFLQEVKAELQLAQQLIAENPPMHPNLVRYRDVQVCAPVYTKDKKPTGKQTCFLVTELAENADSLQVWVAAQFTACYYSDYLAKNPSVTLKHIQKKYGAHIQDKAALDDSRVARYFMRELMNAVASMHSSGIYHYDIKPENIMIDGEKHLKLMDFGLGAVVHVRGTLAKAGLVENSIPTTKLGTAPVYMAPEVRRVIKGDYVLAGPQDIWGCGNSLIKLTCMRQMFPYIYARHQKTGQAPEFIALEVSLDVYMNKYPKMRERFDPAVYADGPLLEDLIRKMMCRDPRSRLTAKQVENHAWLHFGLLAQDIIRLRPDGIDNPFRPVTHLTDEEEGRLKARTATQALDSLIGNVTRSEMSLETGDAKFGNTVNDWTEVLKTVRIWDQQS